MSVKELDLYVCGDCDVDYDYTEEEGTPPQCEACERYSWTVRTVRAYYGAEVAACCDCTYSHPQRSKEA